MPGKDQYRAQLTPDGLVRYNFPSVIKSICRVKVTYFPFDTQVCVLKFGSWSHTMADIDIHPKASTGRIGKCSYNSRHGALPVLSCPAQGW